VANPPSAGRQPSSFSKGGHKDPTATRFWNRKSFARESLKKQDAVKDVRMGVLLLIAIGFDAVLAGDSDQDPQDPQGSACFWAFRIRIH
jgi:hypothetical protein